MTPGPSFPREPFLALALLTVSTAAILLVVALDPRWGYDEAWHLYLSSVTPWTKALEEGLVDAHPPLHHLLLAPIAGFASTPIWFRLPSVLAATATLPLWYGFLRRLRIAPEPALLGTFLLATSFAFLDLGATTRAYALGMCCLMIGLLGVGALLRDPIAAKTGSADAHPNQWHFLLASLGFTFAFAFIYGALFVTLALMLAVTLVRLARGGWGMPQPWWSWGRDQGPNTNNSNPLRDAVGWAGRLALLVFVVGYILILLWFIVGYGRGRGAAAPTHLDAFLLADGGSILEFAWSGLKTNAGWITPQLGQTLATCLFWCLATLMLIGTWRRRRVQHAVFILAIFPLTAILMGAGIIGVYPFGGMIRHQYLLLPLYLLVMVLGIEAVWRRIPSATGRNLLAACVVSFGLFGLGQARQLDPLGQGDTEAPWTGALTRVALTSADGTPIYLSGLAFYPIYAAAYPQGVAFRSTLVERGGTLVDIPYGEGWVGGLGWGRGGWDLYEVRAGSGQGPRILRDRRHWTLPARPDDRFLRELVELMDRIGSDSLRIIRILPRCGMPLPIEAFTSHYVKAGFRVTDIRRTGAIDSWVVRRARQGAGG